MATATATAQKEEISGESPDQQQQQPLSDPPSTNNDSSNGVDKESDESKSAIDSPEIGAAADSTAVKNNDDGDAPDTDIQKKIRRAERFGMSVQFSEEEKRNSRAERFGAGSAIPGTDALKKSEDQKRKARAERFGSVQSLSADEEAKKKARLARFAAVPKADPLEEDKKKARAIRFSQPPSGSLSQVNGKGNDIKLNTPIMSKAGEET